MEGREALRGDVRVHREPLAAERQLEPVADDVTVLVGRGEFVLVRQPVACVEAAEIPVGIRLHIDAVRVPAARTDIVPVLQCEACVFVEAVAHPENGVEEVAPGHVLAAPMVHLAGDAEPVLERPLRFGRALFRSFQLGAGELAGLPPLLGLLDPLLGLLVEPQLKPSADPQLPILHGPVHRRLLCHGT